MTNPDAPQPYNPDALPAAIVRYLSVKDQTRDRQSVLDVFSPDAHVTDEGVRYEGLDAIRGWLSTVATEYTYTTTLTGQLRESPARWVVLARLEGNFPGGVADLAFRFVVDGDSIAELVIAPPGAAH